MTSAGLIGVLCIALQDTAPAATAPVPTAPVQAPADQEHRMVATQRNARELPADMPPDVRAVLQRSWDAVGGPAPLARLKSLQFTMKASGSGPGLHLSMLLGSGGEVIIRQRMPVNDAIVERGFDGQDAWSADSSTGQVRLVEPRAVMQQGLAADVLDVYSRAITTKGLAWDIRQPDVFDGVPVDIVRIWRSGGGWSELLLDQADHIPLAMRISKRDVDEVGAIVRWTERVRVGGETGFLLPLLTTTVSGDTTTEVRFSDVAADTLSPAHFAAPPIVKQRANALRAQKLEFQPQRAPSQPSVPGNTPQ